jgi:hypothetical protein
MTEDAFKDHAYEIGMSDRLTKMFLSGSIRIQNANTVAFNSISDLEHRISNLTMVTMNDSIGVNLGIKEWKDLIDKFNSIGLYNVNFYNLELFYKTLPKISMIVEDKTKISSDLVLQFKQCVKDIQALLDSTVRIGTKINYDEDINVGNDGGYDEIQ